MRLSEKRYLHHFSCRSDKNQRTGDKLVPLMKKICCQLSPLSHVQVRGDPCTNQVQICLKNGNQVATRQKEQILAEVRTEIHKNEVQADSNRRGIQELNEIIESQRREVDHALASDEQLRRDQLLLHGQLSEQNRDLREARMKSLNEMEELKRVQGSRFDEFSSRKIDRKSRHKKMNSRPRLRNYRLNSIVWMTREILRMPNQCAVDYPTFPVNQRYFHLIVILLRSSYSPGDPAPQRLRVVLVHDISAGS